MRITEAEGVTVLHPKGCLTGGEETEVLEREITRIAGEGTKFLVIDCTEVEVINNTALGVLTSAHANFWRRGGQLLLAKINSRIEHIFVITKLSLVFDVYPTVELAVAALTQPQPET